MNITTNCRAPAFKSSASCREWPSRTSMAETQCAGIDARNTYWGRDLDARSGCALTFSRCNVVFSDRQHARNLATARRDAFVRGYVESAVEDAIQAQEDGHENDH